MLVLFLIGNAVLGSGVMMLARGTFPPPFTNRKAHPILSTLVLLVGLTLMLHFGTPELLDELLKAL